ncbi:MAG: phosphoglycerate kinase [Candidatus Peribacter sp.]|jgi:phosphoglycerate kinase|nr:phosphoglycerate kinase [Candidatus Peribacter sp.]MBT4392824.1 phosphoglycerate kinase [Candidatus Peribacter sp.]MBT4601455.1 phosphoglycerate kinase [Candidatus Peribacter sp.]MBT5148772.1 phosphoglycerate kinase [Candidatus Peribacter sp.]MBT5637632.1 phosphoglycerate kinase [Candidatus Peribacter sp.]
MDLPTLDQADLQGKRVLMRAGFDVPIEDGAVHDTTRIDALVPTMKHILDSGASLVLMAHQGRPVGEPNPEFTQKPLVPVLEKILGVTVKFAEKCDGEDAKELAATLQPGEVLLLENLRFEKGEKSADESERDALGKELASLADVYVNDAFTNCHRDHASMTSVPKFIGEKYMGFNVQQEVEGLSKVTQNPEHPVTLIISGLKMETKVPVIEQFLDQGDDILVGGGVANTMLVASGKDVAKSKVDHDFTEKGALILEQGLKEDNATIHLPTDGTCSNSPDGEISESSIGSIPADHIMFDIGPETMESYAEVIANSKTIVWNGPMGMYEVEGFAGGTKALAQAVRDATAAGAVSIIGGGDTLDFHERYDYSLDAYTFVSTAGGAMLDFISGKPLPALEALRS